MQAGAADDRERGTITLWSLGLCVSVMFLGRLGVDLWRTIAVRRELSSIADAAATAGANALDEAALRNGDVLVDQSRARSIALATLAEHHRRAPFDDISVTVDGNRVLVTLRDDVPFSLLSIFMGGDEFVVQARATAEPRELP